MQLLLAFLVCATSVVAFSPSVAKFSPKSSTVLFEDFTANGPQAAIGTVIAWISMEVLSY